MTEPARTPIPTRIRFSDARGWHAYWLDGKRIPGVTSVLNSALSKRGLVKWAAREAATWAAIHTDALDKLGGTLAEDAWIAEATSASDRTRDRAVATGKQVHTLAERLIYGAELPAADETTGEPWPDDVLAMARQLADFFDTTDARPVIHEAAVYNETHRYAGRLDLIADLTLPVGSGRWLLDYKTGASGVWGEASLQATAYRAAEWVQVQDDERALVDVPMIAVDDCAAVWVRPDGWELLPLVTNGEQFAVFRNMLPINRWSSLRIEDLVGGPISAGSARAS